MERDNELEFLKLLCVISAIMAVGNNLATVLSGSSEALGSDNLSKLIDSVQELMLPHRKEELEKKVEKYRGIMEEEHSRGALKIHAVSDGRPEKRKRRISKVR